MVSTRRNRVVESGKNRSVAMLSIFSLVVATVVFFGIVITVVWLSEHKHPLKYSVICYMVGSGILYVMVCTSSLLLLTGLPQESRSLPRQEPNLSLAGCIHNDLCCETASDISYMGGSHLLQLPQTANAINTPPPPYKELSDISTSRNDTGRVQDPNNADDSLSRFYYELNRDEVQEPCPLHHPLHRQLQRENTASGFDIEMQTLTSHRNIRSSSNSYPITNALKQQMASSSPLMFQRRGVTLQTILKEPFGNLEQQESTSSENSPRTAVKVKRNPSRKRKLSAVLLVAHPASHSKKSQNTRSKSNTEVRASRSNRIDNLRSLQQSDSNSRVSPKLPRSIAEERASQSISNLGEKQRDTRLDCNEEIRSSQSNFNPQKTQKMPRSRPETRTSLSNLNPQGTQILRSDAEVRTSQSNSSLEGRQASRLGWNEEKKSSMSNLKPEGTPRFSRSNIVRTSQTNLIPGARLQTSQSSLNVDVKRTSPNLKPGDRKLESLSHLNFERKQLDSKLNNLVPKDRDFPSHCNLHLNTQQSTSNSNSYGLQRVPQVDTNSNTSLKVPSSVGVDLKQTSQPLKQLKKLSQLQQFAACSKNVQKLQKAQSFTSLSVANPLTREKMQTEPKTTLEEHLPNVSPTHQMSGRSTESVLDAAKNSKQMTPQEWIVAWNHGFRKLPEKETEKVVGVRM